MLSGFLAVCFTVVAMASEESPRDKLVKNAQRVEKAVLKDLGTLREKGCKLVKGKKCLDEEKAAPKKAN